MTQSLYNFFREKFTFANLMNFQNAADDFSVVAMRLMDVVCGDRFLMENYPKKFNMNFLVVKLMNITEIPLISIYMVGE